MTPEFIQSISDFFGLMFLLFALFGIFALILGAYYLGYQHRIKLEKRAGLYKQVEEKGEQEKEIKKSLGIGG